MNEAFMPGLTAVELRTLAASKLVQGVTLAAGRYQDMDLSGVRFEAVNAAGAIFEDCSFGQSSWLDCRLDDVRFQRCDLAQSAFVQCQASRLTVSQSALIHNWWQDNTFVQTDLASSVLDDIAVSACTLTGARLPQRLNRAWFSACRMADVAVGGPAQWHQVQIQDSELPRWSMVDGVLTQCAIVRCVLDGLHAPGLQAPFLSLWQCSLREANLSQAQLEGLNVEHADLSNADFSGSVLVRARLVRAQASGARFVRTDLSQADASHLEADNADFSHSRLDLFLVHAARWDRARWTDCDRSRLRLTDPVLLQAEQWRPATP